MNYILLLLLLLFIFPLKAMKIVGKRKLQKMNSFRGVCVCVCVGVNVWKVS